MKNSFDHITSGWLYKTAKMIGDVVIISLLFLLCCLPFFTIGASCSALYYVVYRKYRKGSDDITKDFFRAMKENLKHGVILHVIYSIYSALAGFNIYFALFGFRGMTLPQWYKVIALLPLLPLIFSLPFLYALLARFSNTLKVTVKNSFTLGMMNFPKFLLIWLIVLFALGVSIVFPPAALFTPAGAMYLIQMITEKAFDSALAMTKSRASEDDEDDSDSEGGDEDDVDDAVECDDDSVIENEGEDVCDSADQNEGESADDSESEPALESNNNTETRTEGDENE